MEASEVSYFDGSRPELSSFVPLRHDRVLEVGCGSGGFVRNLPNAREYWGVEPVADLSDAARAKGARLLKGVYSDVSGMIPEGHFDLVVCNDVIEHMEDPWWFLGDVRRHLSGSGVLVGSIPNVRYFLNLKNLLAGKDWEYVDAGILDRTHLRFFTRKSLERMLGESGYEIVRMEGINKAAFPWSPIGIAKKIVSEIAGMILGRDVLFLQFGFVAKPIR